MCDLMTHRGPDDSDMVIQPPIGLGHRRLSIIDLAPSGRQPMSNEDDTLWLIFNGEIYDFHIHRKKLIDSGHRLKSRTDCEPILHLYEEKGINCLQSLNGMFAFALWDQPHKRLFLVRDRLGIKPLHYYYGHNILIFASEIRSILCHPKVPKEIDWQALDLYLTLNYIPPPYTIFKGIKKLLPGTYLLAEKDNITIQPFWDIPLESSSEISERPAESISLEENRQSLRQLLEASVKRRLVSDVPLGAFLSGGLDSSIIVALMARNSNRPVKTFSIGYKDLPSFDETRYAREVANLYRTEHHEFILDHRDMINAFPLVLDNFDEPFADSSAIPTYIVSRETRRQVTVALSGDGGDELFAGYRMYLGEYWSRYYARLPGLIRQDLLPPLINALPEARDNPRLERIRRIKKFIRGMSTHFYERYSGWREVFDLSQRKALLLTPPQKDLYQDLVRNIYYQEKDRFGEDKINLMLYMDLKGLLHADMLTKVDRMSMLHSLEVRVPFLDHTLVESAFKISGQEKLRWNRGKVILLKTFQDLLPPSLIKRPKAGFEIPIGAWLRKELKFLIHDFLDKDRIKKQGIFNYSPIDNLVSRHMKNIEDTSWHLWNLIVFQYWYRNYFE